MRKNKYKKKINHLTFITFQLKKQYLLQILLIFFLIPFYHQIMNKTIIL